MFHAATRIQHDRRHARARMPYNPIRNRSQAGLFWGATAHTLFKLVNVTLIRERLRDDLLPLFNRAEKRRVADPHGTTPGTPAHRNDR